MYFDSVEKVHSFEIIVKYPNTGTSWIFGTMKLRLSKIQATHNLMELATDIFFWLQFIGC